jgi:geranylgeranyl pyrophosphate synthase
VSVAEYLECARKKTAALVAMATVGGGIIAGAAPADLRCLHDFAMLAGVAFQIRDDLLDLNGHKGRARGSDVFEGKRTLMVAHAVQHLSAEQRERLFAILNAPRETTSLADVEWVWRIYAATRAVEFAERTAASLIDRAIRALHPLPESEAKHRFRRLARYMASRTR